MFADLMVFSTDPVGKKKLPTRVSCSVHAKAEHHDDKSMLHGAGSGLGGGKRTGGTIVCIGRSNRSCLSWKAGLGRGGPGPVVGGL